MPYTVKKLAELSGVSIRTLHHYDDIGLLKPAYYGENHYRYYEEEQVLLLQQILFYRELGFSLPDIKEILMNESFDKIEALESHRQNLQGDLNRTKNLIKTIDKTITYLRGEKTMKLEEIFEGFTEEKQKHYLDFLKQSGVSKEEIKQCEEKIKHWGKEKWLANKKQADRIYADLANAIDRGLTPESDPVQTLIREHYKMTCEFWTPNKVTYIGLAELYHSHPDFVAFYDDIHPELLNFLTDAMQHFANKELT